MKMHNFWRSGTSHRTRIALNLKGLSFEYIAVHLGKGAHLSEAFKAVNPQQLVPALDTGKQVMIQSPAIIEWLEECYPEPALLPEDPIARQQVRAMAAIVGCDIHPVNNRRILETLRRDFGADEEAINRWCGRWIADGFDTLEAMLAADPHRGDFCFGGRPTIADIYLIPQVESSRRFKVDVSRWPKIAAVEAACLELEAFRLAAPGVQPDAA
jgi:maleylpyruvate isomerase